LENRVRELESAVGEKNHRIHQLEKDLYQKQGNGTVAAKKKQPARTNSGFKKLSDAKPHAEYRAVDQDDVIDVRLEEFYNSTGCAIQFKRINKGFYRFGDSIVELDIISHKLMARTEDGWNRGKFGPIEKFVQFYENIEREKAGIEPDA